MSKKKIVILGTVHPFRGGLATFNERMARELIAQGHEVILYTFSLQYPNFLFPGKTQYSDDPKPTDLDIRVKVNSVNPFNWLKVGRELRKMAPDILLMKFWIPFIGPSLGTIARRARKSGKTKAIVVVDNMIPHERRPGDMALIRYFAKSVQGFVAMSKTVQADIDKFRKEKPVIYSPHPLYDNFGEFIERQTAKAQLGLDPEKRYLLFFGFIRDYKGLDLALEAMADPRFADSNIQLVVAGEFYSDSKPYTDLIERLGIQDRVVLRTDFIPNSDVGKYFCAADMIVQPYKSATNSGVTQVAYHFNVPMLVTNVGGLAEIVLHDKVGYVTPREPKVIADSIFDFYDRDREAEFKANIREEKKRFGWDHFVGEILKMAETIPMK